MLPGRHCGLGRQSDRLRYAEALAVRDDGPAQLGRKVDSLADRNQHRWIHGADLADRSVAGMNADRHCQHAAVLSSESILQVAYHLVDGDTGLQSPSRSLCRVTLEYE